MTGEAPNQDLKHGGAAVPAAELSKTIEIDFRSTFSFAAYQNSVPIIRSLKITNHSPSTQYNLVLELEATPSFVRPKQWRIDCLHSGQTLAIQDRDLQADPEFLRGLNEAERGELRFRLSDHSGDLATLRFDLRVLARDQWGGMHGAGELLAAFVMPNDPAIGRILKTASGVLENHKESPELEGYQSNDPRRAYLQMSAVWSAITAERLTYANPPSSFETNGQKTRPPERILQERLATCLDTTLLFAGAIEALGLHPVVILRDGHCFVGGWCQDKKFPTVLNDTASELRKAIKAHELVVFETTLVTLRPPGRFEQAIREANAQLSPEEDASFVAAIDVRRARMAGIRPLASHSRGTEDTHPPAEEEPTGPVPLAEAPEFEQLPEEQVEEKPTTSEGRIDRWQRRLLDLSLRNRLLNFKDTKQTIPVLCPDISGLEDHLAAGRSVKIISSEQANAVDGRDAELHRRRTGGNVLEQFAAQAWRNSEIVAPLTERELSARLTTVYRAARSDMAEGGSNTLYLAVGFLRWKQSPDEAKIHRAPLLLIPVKLSRRSAVSQYKLSLHEDEVRFNATLIQLLKKDFALDLTEFESELPEDDSGIDVRRVTQRVRQLIRDVPGFEVVDELALSTFSFAKYLMWKDLVDRIDQLEQNRVVRHLIHNPDQAYRPEARATMPASHQVDAAFDAQELIHPLPADSSQLSAVMAAAKGHDFVLIGPPGTGKSQTIANMVAQCLAEKKTVLFVAEKTAALDVVYRRLREHGLGSCCLELHSNKSERKQFLEQLRESWETQSPAQGNRWTSINARMQLRRDELNEYVRALHAQDPSGWSVYRAMGRVVRDAKLNAPQLNWSSSVRNDSEGYTQLLDTARDLGVTFESIESSSHLRVVAQTEWSVNWERSLLAAAERLRTESAELRAGFTQLIEALGISPEKVQRMEDLRVLLKLARVLQQTASTNCRLLYDKQFTKMDRAVDQLENAAKSYHQAQEQLSAEYDDATVPEIPVKELEAQWREAIARLWPFSFFGRRKVTKLLATYSSDGNANVQRDLSQLHELQRALKSLAENPLDGKTALWNGPNTDVEALRQHICVVTDTRQAVMAVGQHLGNLQILSRRLAPVLTDSSGEHALIGIASHFLAAAARLLEAVSELEKLCGREFAEELEENVLGELELLGAGLQEDRLKLQGWTAWCGVRQRAKNLGLESCIDALESHSVQPADIVDRFELAYARWWLPLAIDRHEALRSFQRFKHEEAIREFRKLDDEARQCASAEVSRAARQELPRQDEVPRRSELGLLRHQMNLQRPSKAIREVVAGMPEAFSKLAPCVLMSPLSIAQYLPASHPPFDVVVFDEASQITTWDAIGAIARAKQTIVVGDPKQLPPTNFFGRADNADDGLEDEQQDLESILDETKAAGLPVLDLRWHYRSRHESLIAFSNHQYYGNSLITFPSADLSDCGVELKHVTDGCYDRGASRTNRKEAETVVAEAVRRMTEWLKLPEEQRLTLGVVTFNQTQQTLIQDLFDKQLQGNPELEWYFSDDRIEPTVVKNLENVQGDERDVIIFSITYGKDSANRFNRNFGALNNPGGERRLNVAVTRARQLLMVCSSFTADELDVNGLNSRGVIDLKHFLEFAEKGEKALAAQIDGSQGDLESPFEEAVAQALRSKGWRVVPQVGVSKFRIDLGIVHPHRPGSYLAGIECDGATYHSSASARDRDKVREQILRNLGWEILRIWSPDWWHNCEGALDRVDAQLHELLQHSLQKEASTDPAEPATPSEELSRRSADAARPEDGATSAAETAPSAGDATNENGQTAGTAPSPETPSEHSEEMTLFGDKPPSERSADSDDGEMSETLYVTWNGEEWETEPDRFFEASYDASLIAMLRALLHVEAPIHEGQVAQRIARAHGWTRTGRRIKERVFSLLEEFPKSSEISGTFFWDEAGPKDVVPFRQPTRQDERRPIEQIAVAELHGCICANPGLLEGDDPEGELGRAVGYARITSNMRLRLTEAIERARECAEL